MVDNLSLNDSSELAKASSTRSSQWPFHPGKNPKIDTVTKINGHRMKGPNLQFHVIGDDNTTYEWVNVTELRANELVTKYFKTLSKLEETQLKPKPYREFVQFNEHIIHRGSYTPVRIVQEITRNNEKWYMVVDDKERLIMVDQEYIQLKYPDLENQYFQHRTCGISRKD